MELIWEDLESALCGRDNNNYPKALVTYQCYRIEEDGSPELDNCPIFTTSNASVSMVDTGNFYRITLEYQTSEVDLKILHQNIVKHEANQKLRDKTPVFFLRLSEKPNWNSHNNSLYIINAVNPVISVLAASSPDNLSNQVVFLFEKENVYIGKEMVQELLEQIRADESCKQMQQGETL